MLIEFFKYQGAGNDFIILDNRRQKYDSLTTNQIKKLCDRHFGIGADGLMLLNSSLKFDFSMTYFNSDGNEGTMCGNGGRCITRFANDIKIINNKTTFEAIDGKHEAEILENNTISLRMSNVDKVVKNEEGYILDTGSAHLVIFKNNIENIDIIKDARKIRYSKKYFNEGINVNFVAIIDGDIYSRTYERGVENETLACGTGAVAVAISNYIRNGSKGDKNQIINAVGGKLEVQFDVEQNQTFTNIYLTGPAEQVFTGKIEI